MTLEMTEIQVDMDVYKAIEAHRVSFKQSKNDILREILGLKGAGLVTAPPQKFTPNEEATTRKRATGDYSFELEGSTHTQPKLIDAYLLLVRLLARRDAAFLPALAKLTTRNRRIVSKESTSLYLKSPHLAKEHAHKLVDDWYIDGNLSQEQVETRIKLACDVAGLKFGTDVVLDFPSVE
jgi:negative regulator of replication initiation